MEFSFYRLPVNYKLFCVNPTLSYSLKMNCSENHIVDTASELIADMSLIVRFQKKVSYFHTLRF